MKEDHQVENVDLQNDLILRVLMTFLSKHLQALATECLNQLSVEEFGRLRTRLAALSAERFCILMEELEGMPERRLLKCLKHFAWNDEMVKPVNKYAANLNHRPDKDQKIILQPPPLPTEISDMIWDKFYEAVFIPGEIEVCSPLRFIRHDDNNGEDNFLTTDYFWYHGNRLKLLDRKLYDQYKRRYWTENTVPGIGSARFTVDVLEQLSAEDWHSIRSTRLILTLEDSELYWGETYNESDDLLRNLGLFLAEGCEAEVHLLSTWSLKAQILFRLKLERLVLDVSEAFSPNGDFLGLKVARAVPQFHYGIPRHFEVIAPTQTLAKGVRRIIENLNT